MATRQAVRQAVTETPRMLRQAALQRITDLTKQSVLLEEQKKNLDEQIDAAEQEAIAILKKGGIVEPGRLQAAIAVTKGVVRPKWAEICEARLGAEAIKKIKAETPPGKDKDELVISGVGVGA